MADAARGGDVDPPATALMEQDGDDDEEEEDSLSAAPARKKKPQQKKALGVKKTLEKPTPRKAPGTAGGASFFARGVAKTDSGEKFWQVRVEPGSNQLTVTFGKLGAKGQTKVTPCSDSTAATSEAKKQAKQKAAKGYAF